jgi:putative endonuclease
MHYAYLLKCADGTYYSGCTNDLEKRLYSHNHLKSGAHYTKIRRPVVLVHAEKFRSLAKARAREAEVKRMTREEKEALITQKKK